MNEEITNLKAEAAKYKAIVEHTEKIIKALLDWDAKNCAGCLSKNCNSPKGCYPCRVNWIAEKLAEADNG